MLADTACSCKHFRQDNSALDINWLGGGWAQFVGTRPVRAGSGQPAPTLAVESDPSIRLQLQPIFYCLGVNEDRFERRLLIRTHPVPVPCRDFSGAYGDAKRTAMPPEKATLLSNCGGGKVIAKVRPRTATSFPALRFLSAATVSGVRHEGERIYHVRHRNCASPSGGANGAGQVALGSWTRSISFAPRI